MKVWHIDSSNRKSGSVSRQLTATFVDRLKSKSKSVEVVYRDVGESVPLLTEEMIGAYFTPKEQRTQAQQNTIQYSDQILREAKNSDVWVIGAPVYNFSMPGSLKAWADQLARVGETFKYTENGPVGLLEGKKAYVIVTSGGTKVGSEIDFLTPWLKQFLGFVGVTDVSFVKADQLTLDQEKLQKAEETIAQLVEA